MLTRKNAELIIQEYLDMSSVPEELLDLFQKIIFPELLKGCNNKSQFLRFVFSNPELSQLRDLQNNIIAKIFKVNESLICRIKNSLIENSEVSIQKKIGRIPILPENLEMKIRDWLIIRTERMEWPTFSLFKEYVLNEIEANKISYLPSKQYYFDLLKRISNNQLTIKIASALDPFRYNITPNIIIEFFNSIANIGIDQIDPRLIINVDETGFGSAKSQKSKKQKVIVPTTFSGTPVYESNESSRFITCIASATLSGSLLKPAFIVNRKHQAIDSGQCSYSNNSILYYSTTSFISEKIFNDYIRNVIVKYVEELRVEIDGDKRALLIVDGHKSHSNELLKTICAHYGIMLILLPPHSSHILQPLDQLIFKRMKSEYSQFGQINYLSKISSSLERVFNAYQASNIIWIIWRSWSHCGFIPQIENGKCRFCLLDPNTVLSNDLLQHPIKVNESTRGQKNERGEFGILNQKEYEMMQSGICPLCHKPLQE